MKKGIIFLVFFVLAVFIQADESAFFQKAEDLLNEYEAYQPPVMGTIGSPEQTVAESWEQYYQEQYEKAQTGGLRVTGDMTVKTMPDYYTWPTQSITLWGNVEWENYSGSGTYYWDFGDGTQSASFTISNQRYLSTTHTYANMATYYATLVVEDNLGATASASTRILVMDMADAEVNKAVEDGLRYLYLQQYADGHWYGNYSYSPAPEVAATALAILSYEENGHLPWLSPDDDIFKEVVQRGFQYLWGEIEQTVMTTQTAGNPDTDGNGYGYHFSNDRSTYADPMVLLAIITSGSQDQVITNGPAWVIGQTYYEVAQNIVDQLLWSQTESGNYRGGWRYMITTANYGTSDTSTTQWPVLGLIAAENWDIPIPGWVYSELSYWTSYVQYSDGGFGYDAPGAGNLSRVGSGITSLYAQGQGLGALQVQNALNWIANNFTTNDGYSGIYGIYSMYKGLWFYDLLNATIGTHPWYSEFTEYLLTTQTTSGTWSGSWGSTELNTAFGILTLTPRVIIPTDELAIAMRNINISNFPDVTLFIDVYSYGQPLEGLSAADFVITEDGVLQDITSNYEFDQYLVTYTSTTPYPTSNDRIVIAEVASIIDGMEYSAFDDNTYIIQEIPVIQRTEETIALSGSNQTAGGVVFIEAWIYDEISPYITSATLHYRTSSTGADFASVVMNNISDNLWLGSVNNGVQSPGIDYYISATDGLVTVTDPENSPMAFPYQIPVDNQLPVITHTPVLFSQPLAPVNIQAEVFDESDSVATVLLHYKSVDSFLWNYAEMSFANGTWSAEIPGEFMGNNGALYFISAQDNFGLTANFGTYDDPLHLVNAAKGNIKGNITDSGSGSPVYNAAIELIRNGQVIRIVYTDALGNYRFYAVNPGNYTLRAGKVGYLNMHSGILGVTASTEITNDFLFLPNDNIDLSVNTVNVIPASGGTEPLLISSQIRNLGGQTAPASQVKIEEKDLTLPQQPVVEIYRGTIPALGSGASYQLEIPYTASSAYLELIISADSDNSIPETDESNNVMQGEIQFEPPVINAVTALYDGDANPDVIGRFLTISGWNIPPSLRLNNVITASVFDPEGTNNIERVEFEINGIILIDDDAADGWSVEYDMSQLPANNVILMVTAYDKTGLASEPVLQTIDMMAAPEWLDNFVINFAEEDPIGYSNGYFYFELILDSVEGGGEIYDFSYFLGEDVEFFGSAYNEVTGGINVCFRYPVDAVQNPELTGGFKLVQTLLGEEAGEQNVAVNFSLDAEYNLAGIAFEFMEEQTLFTLDEDFTINTGILERQALLSTGLDIFGNLTYSAEAGANLADFNFHYMPETGGSYNNGSETQLFYGLAKSKAVVSPHLSLIFDLNYSGETGLSSITTGEMEISYNLLTSFFWGRQDNDIISGTYGSWALEDNRLIRDENLILPQSLPYPQLTADALGNVALVWISDKNTDEDIIEPEVDFRYKPDGEEWQEAVSITDNDLFETTPDLAFMNDGRLMAVWTQNTIPQSEAAGVTIEEILYSQDIYYAIRDTLGEWSAASAIIADETGDEYSDGIPQIAFSATSQGLAVWTRSENNGQPLTNGALEIYYSLWVEEGWSAPAQLTVNATNDFESQICYGAGNQAMAVWQNDADGNPLTAVDNELFFSLWDGALWSAPQNLTTNSLNEQSPSLASLSNGDYIVTWVERETLADNSHQYSLYADIYNNSAAVWEGAELVFSDNNLMEEPAIDVDSRDIACIIFRGYDGFDGELFYTSRELDNPGSGWIMPDQQTEDELTRWFVTAGIDAYNNLRFVDYPYDFADSTAVVRGRGSGDFVDGLSLISRGIREDGTLMNGLNYGMVTIAPDLQIDEDDITLGEEQVYSVDDTMPVSYTVHNTGSVTGTDFEVQLFDGTPETGALLQTETISLQPDESAVIQYEWLVTAGAHQFTVMLDPADMIIEQDETNNTAVKNIAVYPDLSADEMAISDTNPLSGSPVNISVLVTNISGSLAEDVNVGFYDNGVIYATESVDSLAVGASEIVTVPFITSDGLHELRAVANPDSIISENDFSNNGQTIILDVIPDLVVLAEDISFQENGLIEITSLLHNLGGRQAQNISFQFWNGNPLAPQSVIIAEMVIDSLAAFSEIPVTVQWDAPYGLSVVYVRVDAANTIRERNEGNNVAHADLIHLQITDLVADTLIFAESVQQWDILPITFNVINQSAINATNAAVRFYDGDPFAGGYEIGGNSCSLIEAGETVSFSINWQVRDAVPGTHTLYAMIDPDSLIVESSETNNLISGSVEVLEDITSPEMFITPHGFDVLVHTCSTEERTFFIHNTGSSVLEYALAAEIADEPELNLRNSYHPSSEVLNELGDLLEQTKSGRKTNNISVFDKKKRELALVPDTRALKLAPAGSRDPVNNNPGNGAGFAGLFDGNNDYLRTADIDLSVFTLETWAYPTAQVNSDHNCLIAKWYNGNNNVREYMFSIMSGGYVRLYYSSTGGEDNYLDTPSGLIQENQWYHLAATLDGEYVRLYINGEIMAETAWNHTVTSNGSGAIWIGTYYDNNWTFNGQLDETRIWNYARNQQQIQSAMYSQLSSSEPGLVDYLTYDGHFVDMSGNGNGGTPYGDVTFIESQAPIGTNFFSYTATDVPHSIGPATGTVTESVLEITDEYLVGDLNVTIDIEHTSDADLTIEIISPQGTSIILSSFNGGTGDNYQVTIFNDEEMSYITSGTAPFNGSYKPWPGSLSSFDGELVTGEWILRITDYCNGDGGMLNGWSLDLAQLGPQWLMISPMAGNIIPAGDDAADILFDPVSLYPGIYYANILVNTNDPVLPQDAIFTTTTIEGIPELIFSADTLSFVTTYAGLSNSLPLTIYNLGNGALDISDITFTSEVFSASETGFIIPVGESYTIMVNFAPVTSQTFNEELTVISNDELKSIILEGTSILPPTISIDPDNFSAVLQTGQQSYAALSITNSGEDTLVYETQARIIPAASYAERIYTVSSNDNSVKAINGITGETIGSITIPYQPFRLTLNDAGTLLWITYLNSGLVSYIPVSEFGDTLAVLTDIDLGGANTSGVALSHNCISDSTGFAYVGNPAENVLEKINLATGEVTSYSFTNVDPQALELSHDGLNLYVLSSGYLHVFNTFTEQFTQLASGYTSGYDLMLSPDGRWLYVTDRYRIRRYDTVSQQYVNELNILNYGRIISVSPDGNVVIAADLNSDQIRIMTGELTLLSTVTGLNKPLGVAISEDNQWCYISERDDDELTRLDMSSFTLDPEWSVFAGDNPMGITLSRSITAPWAYTEPVSGFVEAGQTENIQMVLDAAGVLNGEYSAELWVESTDPFQPRVIADLDLIVSDGPEIVVSTDSLIFANTIFVGLQDSLTFTITNTGYADLNITDIVITNSVFTADTAAFTLPQAAQQTVTIYFTPDATAQETDMITILNNDQTQYISLAANGLLPPVMAVYDTLLSQTLTFQETATQNVTLYNEGNSDLEYQARVLDSLIPESCVNMDGNGDILSIPDHVNWQFASGDFSISLWFTLANLDRVHDGLFGRNDYQWLALEYNHDSDHRLNLWIDSSGASPWELSNLKPEKNDWIADQWYHLAVVRDSDIISIYIDGEEVINTSYTQGVYNPMGVPLYFGRSQLSNRYHQGNLDDIRIWNYARTETEIQASMYNSLTGRESGLTGYWNFNDVDPWKDISGYGNDCQPSGNTHIINSDLMLAPSWLCLSEAEEGTIASGGSADIELYIHPENLLSGNYTAEMRITGNDPFNTEDIVAVNLNYTGMPVAELTPESLDFGTIYVGETKELTFTVTNTGTDSLVVTGVDTGNPVYSVTPETFGLAVDNSCELTVVYEPSAAVDDQGEIQLLCNTEISGTVTLTGSALVSPAVSVYPTAIIDTLYTGDQNSHLVTLSNNGGSILNYQIINGNIGNGADGELVVNAGEVYYSNNVRSPLSGNNESGQNMITLSDVSGFSSGDEILIISMQDAQPDLELNVTGRYETHYIETIMNNVVYLEDDLQYTYDQSDGKKHQAVRIPQFTNVTINGTLTCPNWNGETGGIICFRANNQVTVNAGGIINATGKGYRGHNRQGDNLNGYQGESITGLGIQSSEANANAGGGGAHAYSGGGGGGFAENGEDGQLGTSGMIGNGGEAIGDISHFRLFFGGAGGTGGDNDNNQATNPNGGSGGGIVFMGTRYLTGEGIITSNGGNGNASISQDGGAGGGAGGSILIKSYYYDVSLTEATGGIGFTPPDAEGGKGGDGSPGFIRINTHTIIDPDAINPLPYMENYDNVLPYWISAAPGQGSILPGESADVLITLNAAGLLPENHLSDIMILSNDINNAELAVPVSLTVNQAESITVQDTLAFAAIYIDTLMTLPLPVYSNGSLPLTISSLEIGNYPEVFILSDSTFTIPAGECDTLWVTFSPDTVMLYTDILQITCNDPTNQLITVTLTGEGLDDPVIAITPEAYDIIVLQDDLLNETLTINNIGGDLLTGTIRTIVADSIASSVDNFDDGLWDDFWNYSGSGGSMGITSGESHSAPYSLQQYAYNYDTYITSEPVTIVDSYLRISCWFKITQSELSCDFRLYWQKNGGDFNLLYDSPDNQLMDWTYLYYEITDVEAGDNICVRLYTNVGSTTSSADQITTFVDDIMIAPLYEFITLEEDEFSIEYGESHDIPLIFHADDMDFGEYPATIVVTSNDPMQPEINIPITVTVPVSDIDISPLTFEQNLACGDSLNIYPVISNMGLSRLIGSVYPDIPDFLATDYDNFDDGLWNDFWTAGGGQGSVAINSSQYYSAPYSLRIYASNEDRYITSPVISVPSSYLKVSCRFKVTLAELSSDFRVYWQKNGGGFGLLYHTADNVTYGWTNMVIDLSGQVEPGDNVEIRFYSNVGSTTSSSDEVDAYIDNIAISTEGGIMSLSGNDFDLEYLANYIPEVELNGADIPPGNYEVGLNIVTNDPDESLRHIPIAWNLLNAPGIRVSADSLYFGQVFLNGESQNRIYVTNIGSDTLVINNAMLVSDVFSIALDGISRTTDILPGETASFDLYFSPDFLGTVCDTLIFVSNDPTNVLSPVVLTGEGIAAPEIILSPSVMEVSLTTQDSLSAFLSLENTGDNDLEYRLYPRLKTDTDMWHYAYVTNYNSNSMSIINLETQEVETLTGLYSHPHNIDMDPAGNNLWITYTSDNEISVYDLETGLWKTIIGLGSNRRGCAFSPDGTLTYVADQENNRIEIYAADSLALINTFSTDLNDPAWLDVTPDGKYLYCSDTGTDRVHVFDTETFVQVASITGFTDPWGIRLSPNGEWFACRDGANVKIGETEGNTIIANISGIANPRTPAWSPDNRYLYIGNWDSYKIHIVETETFTIIKEYTLPYRVWSVQITEDSRYLIGSLAEGNRIVKIDLITDEISYINVGTYPTTITTFRTKQPVWLSVVADQLSGVIEPHNQTEIELNFNTTSLNGGDYYAELPFFTNDPLNEDFVYDIILHHNSDAPFLYIADENLVIEEAWCGFENRYDLLLANTGTEILTVSDVTCQPDQFYPLNTSFTIDPDTTYILPVICYPTDPGSLSGTIFIESDGGNITLALSAEAFEPPVIAVNPEQISTSVLPEAAFQENINLANTGVSDLKYYTSCSQHKDKLFIGNQNKFQVIVWNPATEETETINLLFGGPWRMKYSPDGSQLWITYEDFGYVTVLDAYTNEIISNIFVEGVRTSGIAFDKNGNYAYVGNWTNNRVEIINARTFTWEGSITGNMSSPQELLATPDGSKLFVLNSANAYLVVIDLLTNTYLQVIGGYSIGYDMKLSPDGEYLYWVDRLYVRKVNIADLQVVVTSPNLGEIRGIEISPAGDLVYVCSYASNKIVVLETETLTQTSQIENILNPWDITMSFDKKYLYASLYGTNRIALIDIASGMLQENISLGSSDFEFRDITSSTRNCWLSVTAPPDTLAASESSEIALNIDMEDMPDGLYSAEFVIFSNAPAEPVKTIPVDILIGPNPNIVSIIDIPEDEGGFVDLAWQASSADIAGADEPISYYSIWRKSDEPPARDNDLSEKVTSAKTSAFSAKKSRISPLSVHNDSPAKNTTREDDDYEIVVSFIPANQNLTYSSVVPTLADSTAENGIYWSVFKVCAHTSNPGIYYFSLPDSGYSVNNTVLNSPPTINLPGSFSFEENSSLLVNFSPYIDDINGDQLTLSVSGNQNVNVDINGVMVNFSAVPNWDGSEILTFTVDDNQLRATASDIVQIIVTPSATEIVSKILTPGWNWFSLNVAAESMTVNNVLSSIGTSNDYIKNQSSFASYYPGVGWIGSMNEIDLFSMYMIDMNAADTLIVLGTPVALTNMEYAIVPGWNWISYAPQQVGTVSASLAGLEDNASFIKNQSAFASYYAGVGWLGSLNQMVPLDGYKLDADVACSFFYPFTELTSCKMTRNVKEKADIPAFRGLQPSTSEYNGSLLLSSEDGIPENSSISAYCNNELRSICQLLDYSESLGRKYYALMLYSNSELEEGFQLYYQENEDAELLDLDYEFIFTSDMVLVDFADPIMVSLQFTDTDAELPFADKLSIYPNPFNPVTCINFELAETGNVLLEIYNLKGQKVTTLLNNELAAGKHSLNWNAEEQASGIYLLHYETNAMQEVRKLILLK